ncbi:MAG: VOC family protein [Cellulomonadaceae bacterium]|jgi:predicted enzyme related to lactoylglutathione lyase|nr:VOC family protein [Cellulomonadaceae bacterium]
MPLTGFVPEGAPTWIDLATPDLDASVTFYTGLFGWGHTDLGPEAGHYGMFTKGGRKVAGIIEAAPGQPQIWAVYLRTDDINTSITLAGQAGGMLLAGPHRMPGEGSLAAVADAAGAPVFFFQPGGSNGFEVIDEAGAAVWFEQWSSDYDASVDFYRTAAKWPVNVMDDSPDFRYCTYGAGESARAGIFDAAEVFVHDGGQSAWHVYFGVDDVDAALATAVELGGTVTGDPHDSPHGRLVQVTDPHGTTFFITTGHQH